MDPEIIKNTMRQVLDEQRSKSDVIDDQEHYLHHIWLRDHIKTQKDIGVIARESAIKWGVPALLGGVLWALWQVMKDKLTGN